MKFMIQFNLINEEQLLKIKDSVDKYPHEYVSVLPFSHEIKADGPIEGIDYIPYGSTLFVNLAYELKWKGLYFDKDKFTYKEALKNRTDMLNDNVMTAEEAVKFIRHQDQDKNWFIRPSEDLKQFAGMVKNGRECADWLQDAMLLDSSVSSRLNPTTEVVVSKVKDILGEWRWFIVGGKVISGSMYRNSGMMHQEIVTSKDLIDEAQRFADVWLPHENCVMDMALISGPNGAELKVIEFNGINASGFYANDVKAVFDALWAYEMNK